MNEKCRLRALRTEMVIQKFEFIRTAAVLKTEYGTSLSKFCCMEGLPAAQ
jgi:hypothetical protein